MEYYRTAVIIVTICICANMIISILQFILYYKFFKDKQRKSIFDSYRFFWPLTNESKLRKKYVQKEVDQVLFNRLMRLRVLSWIFYTPIFTFFGAILVLLILSKVI